MDQLLPKSVPILIVGEAYGTPTLIVEEAYSIPTLIIEEVITIYLDQLMKELKISS